MLAAFAGVCSSCEFGAVELCETLMFVSCCLTIRKNMGQNVTLISRLDVFWFFYEFPFWKATPAALLSKGAQCCMHVGKTLKKQTL